MVWDTDHTVVCDGCQWVMKQQTGLGRKTKDPLVQAGGHVDKTTYRAYCPMCLLDVTVCPDIQTTDPHFQMKTRAQRQQQKNSYWKRPDAEEQPVAEPCMETGTYPLPQTYLAETPVADSWAGVTEWADRRGPVGRCNSQAAAASSMGTLPPDANGIPCQPTEAPGHQWNAEVVYELRAICNTMTDIKNLLETLVSRLPDTRRL